MAKPKMAAGAVFHARPKVKRAGVHAKTKHSGLKSSKLYKKKYRGQG
jgi:hypothetical protein